MSDQCRNPNRRVRLSLQRNAVRRGCVGSMVAHRSSRGSPPATSRHSIRQPAPNGEQWLDPRAAKQPEVASGMGVHHRVARSGRFNRGLPKPCVWIPDSRLRPRPRPCPGEFLRHETRIPSENVAPRGPGDHGTRLTSENVAPTPNLVERADLCRKTLSPGVPDPAPVRREPQAPGRGPSSSS